jgi:hypothetical protein
MPFGEWFDEYYDNIYQPAIEEAGLIPRRADDLYRPSAIVHDIWDLTQKAKIILADLSGKNPNVFYELGLAHAIAKPAILVTETIEDVPFDLRALRVLVYDKNEPDWGSLLRKKIVTSIKEITAAPLEAVLPTFLKVKADAKPVVTRSEKEMITLRQDIDLLKSEMQRRSDRPTISGRPLNRGPILREEAEEMVNDLVRNKFPYKFIVSRLTERGAPELWVRKRIREAKLAALNVGKRQNLKGDKPA